MSRSCQSATFSSPTTAPRPDDARQPADPLGDDRVPLVRHRRRPLLTAAEWLLDLPHLRPGEVADLEREPLERRCEQRERVQHLGVAVALEDLRRARSGLEPEPLAGDPLDLGLGRRVGADSARELADPHPFERPGDAGAITLEREGPARELETEGRRLGVDAVRAADRQGLAMLLGTRHDGGEGPVDPGENQCAGVADLQRESGVEHIRRRQPVVKPAPLLAEPLGDRVDEGGDVVVRPRLDLRNALRRRNDGPLANRLDRLARHDAGLRPALQCGELDLQPARQPRLVRPDRRHGRAGVARNHSSESTARLG